MPYTLTEVDGQKYAGEINRINDLFPDDFLPLKPRHLAKGFWWLVYCDGQVVGFAGMVPFEPFPRVGYLKRAAVLPEHRGNGLQERMMIAREMRALTDTDWLRLVSETHVDNVVSANNFIAAGYRLCEVERPWAEETLFWIKELKPCH